MELEDEAEEDDINSLAEMDIEPIVDDTEEVVFSPCTAIPTHSDAPQIAQQGRWGPTQAQRKSTRVNVGNRTMLEIAMEKRKVENLEAEKGTNKGTIVKNSFCNFVDPTFIVTAKKIGIEIDVDAIHGRKIKKVREASHKPGGLNERIPLVDKITSTSELDRSEEISALENLKGYMI